MSGTDIGLLVWWVVFRIITTQDQILDPDMHAMRSLLMKNPAFKVLPALSGALAASAHVAQTHKLFPKPQLDAWEAAATLGNRTVSLTYALFNLCVVFPKVKGSVAQTQTATTLREGIQASDFKEAWSTLPACIRKAIDSFGR